MSSVLIAGKGNKEERVGTRGFRKCGQQSESQGCGNVGGGREGLECPGNVRGAGDCAGVSGGRKVSEMNLA